MIDTKTIATCDMCKKSETVEGPGLPTGWTKMYLSRLKSFDERSYSHWPYLNLATFDVCHDCYPRTEEKTKEVPKEKLMEIFRALFTRKKP